MQPTEPDPWHAITTATIKDLASTGAFTRGRDCARGGRITDIQHVDDLTVRARVAGSAGETYLATLRLVDDANGEHASIAASCTCPAAVKQSPCKHAVGLALLVADEPLEAPTRKPRRTERRDPLDQLAELLDAAPKDAIVDEVLVAAERDPRLRDTLSARLTRFRPGPIDTSSYKELLQRSLRVSGHMHWHETSDWARAVEEAVVALDDLVEPAPADAVRLCEYAMKRLEAVYGRVDDSGGEITMLLAAIRPIHLAAVHRCGEHPEKLAARLYELETATDLDVVRDSYIAYADALGDAGRAWIRDKAEQDWEEVADATWSTGDWERYRRRGGVARIIELVAREERDSERLVEVLGGGLDSPVGYQRAVRALLDIEDLDGALQLCADGIAEHPRDGRLVRTLVDVHGARGDTSEAVAAAWQLFAGSLTTEAFDLLRSCAEAAGQWDERRAAAFAAARDVAVTRGSGSALAALHAHVGECDEAWRVAQELGCDEHTLMQIAQGRETTHPVESAEHYLAALDDPLRVASKSGYQRAVALLARADALLETPAQRARFDDAIEELRTGAHRRKTSLMKMLDARGW